MLNRKDLLQRFELLTHSDARPEQWRGKDERGSVEETQMKRELCTEEEDGSSVYERDDNTPPSPPPPSSKWLIQAKNKNIISPINVRLPSAFISVASVCDSTLAVHHQRFSPPVREDGWDQGQAPS